ncbi:unnamed protein product [Allacma fusca]|uniref:Peptidase S1 domain-containing protein n=1 Tax=Allacma fusca TaxID=39272 RepID=A0A8J2KIU3_9HEXA|nr:unnamed protein product [Allacma fusca]
MASDLMDSVISGILPNLVQINLQDGSNLCTGSIITPQLILTAAICVYQTGLLANLSVVAGKSLSGEDSGTEQVRSVREIILHKDYAVYATEYNLALLILEDPLTFTDAVRNFYFPKENSIFSELSIQTGEKCESFWNETLQSQFKRNLDTGRIFCAGRTKQGPCYGDEGLPLICTLKDGDEGENKQPYLCGIVSLADENCSTGLFTDIRKYPQWVLENFGALVQIPAETPSQRYFKCSNAALIDKSLKCDGYDDCGDGSDEKSGMCAEHLYFSHTEADSGEGVGDSQLEGFHSCYTNMSVPSVYKYVPESSICNGINDCRLASDETNCKECKDGAFRCKNNQCVPARSKCNGVPECADGSDEILCNEQLNSIAGMNEVLNAREAI